MKQTTWFKPNLGRGAWMLLFMLLTTTTAWADLAGSGTKDDPYQITTAADLMTMSGQTLSTDLDGVYFQLMNDIAFNKLDINNLSSIASGDYYFQGVFDGGGHTIRGIRIETHTTQKGLFASIGVHGVVKNLNVADTEIKAYNMSGIIASYSEGVIENCHVGSDVLLHAINPNGSQYGGIAGLVRAGRITNCVCEANITLNDATGGYNSMGGIVGELNGGKVEDCVFTGSLQTSSLSTCTNNFAVVGKYFNGTISNCYYTKSTLNGGYSNVSLAYTITCPPQYDAYEGTWKGVSFDGKFYLESGATFYLYSMYSMGNSTCIFDVRKTSDNSLVQAGVVDCYVMPDYDITLIAKEPWETMAYPGSETKMECPVFIGYFDEYTRSQYVIPASDLADMNGKDISALTFYTATNYSYTTESTVDVYLKEVNYTSITAYETKASSTVVYHGTLDIVETAPFGATLTIEFDTPYSYHGGNLMIGMENTDATDWNEIYFYGQEVTGASIAGFSTNSLDDVKATPQNFIPMTTFTCGSVMPQSPQQLTTSDLASKTVTISWTAPNANVTGYKYQYMPAGAYWTDLASTTTTSVNLTGLTHETDYSFRVKAIYSDGESSWRSLNFTTLEGCPKPTNLTAANITTNTADLSWTGTANAYNVVYKKADGIENIISKEEFSAGRPTGWEVRLGLLSKVMSTGNFDDDWDRWRFNEGEGYKVFDSHAITNNTYKDHKDWLITPEYAIGANMCLNFDLALTSYFGAAETNGTDDRFVVLISTDNMATWTILREWNNSGSAYVYNDIATDGENITLDLSSYASQNVRIGFYAESTVQNAQNYIHIDNVAIGQLSQNAWQDVVTNNPYITLTGLTADSKYEYQIQADYGTDGLSQWTDIASFNTLPTIVLANNSTENTDVIIANKGKTCQIVLADRTLYKDGDWNTICLPFNVVLAGSVLEGAEARTMSNASISNKTLNLTFSNPVEELIAGVPYIIKWTSGENIVNPVFNGVTIYKPMWGFDPYIYYNGIFFCGTYDKLTIASEDRSLLLLGANNQLFYPDGKATSTIGACRAYFVIDDNNSAARQFTGFSISFEDDTPTSIGLIESKESLEKTDVWYGIDGRGYNSKPSKKGLYIVNGKKVAVK